MGKLFGERDAETRARGHNLSDEKSQACVKFDFKLFDTEYGKSFYIILSLIVDTAFALYAWNTLCYFHYSYR